MLVATQISPMAASLVLAAHSRFPHSSTLRILLTDCWIFNYVSVIQVEETLAENSVVYGGGCDRRKAADRPAPQTLQIDFLSKVALVDV